jgi:hypothetical protein
LSATPHNGHSNSFSALLEILDPQRFTRGVPVKPRDLDPVMVRRLKSDLRHLGEKFPERRVEPIVISGLPNDAPELLLSRKLAAYGEAIRARTGNPGNGSKPGIGNNRPGGGNRHGIGNGNRPGAGDRPGIGNGNRPGAGNRPGIGNGNRPWRRKSSQCRKPAGTAPIHASREVRGER